MITDITKGLDSLILAAYSFLSHNWAAGDEIILIGFSRGAFAMRCLIDLLIKCGLLAKTDLHQLPALFKDWKRERKNRKEPIPKIKVCALWDTVASLHSLKSIFPIFQNHTGQGQGISHSGTLTLKSLLSLRKHTKYPFVHSALLEGVENAFQAVSIHEHRSYFLPLLWKLVDNGDQNGGTRNLEQCWFSGYHSDIGGGANEEALSHFPLVWIFNKLQSFISISQDGLWACEQDPITAWKVPSGSMPLQKSYPLLTSS